jgi:tetratricopeptide (TPR) repeat protein
MKRYFLTIVALLIMGAMAAQNEQALPPLSPKASTAAQIGFTTVSINYSSPAVRERTIWGVVVEHNRIWRAGANASTTIEFSTDVQINDKTLAKGKYAFFLIPDTSQKWTAVFNKDAQQWGAFVYKAEKDALRTEVTVETLPQKVERLTYQIEEISLDKGLIALSWDKKRILIPFTTNAMQQSLVLIENRLVTAETDKKFWFYHEAAQFLLQYDGDSQKALQYVDESIKLKPFTLNWWTKARLLAKIGDFNGAVEATQKSIEIGNSTKEEKGIFGVIKNEVEKSLEAWKKHK